MSDIDFKILEEEANKMKFDEVIQCIEDSIRNYLQNVGYASANSKSRLVLKSLLYLKNENNKLKNRISELNLPETENDVKLLSAVKTIIKQIKG